jgi:hypothetical protein
MAILAGFWDSGQNRDFGQNPGFWPESGILTTFWPDSGILARFWDSGQILRIRRDSQLFLKKVIKL